MNTRILRPTGLLATLAASLLLGACAHKQVASAPPTPPPPPAKPAATLAVTPDSVNKGQPVQLTWKTQDTSNVEIEGMGTVAPNGTRTLTPPESTTYTLIAKGPGGTTEATARVTVTVPVAEAPALPSDAELFSKNMKDVFFDYDKYELRPADQAVLQADALFLSAHPQYKLLISGHCDERGSEEYNLALGSDRATAVRDALTKLGVSADRVKTISYGKEKPFCNDEAEQCWQQNRRAHFVIAQ